MTTKLDLPALREKAEAAKRDVFLSSTKESADRLAEAMDPFTVLALLDRIEEMRRDYDKLYTDWRLRNDSSNKAFAIIIPEQSKRIAALELRRDELLATIVRLTNETPFPDEIKGWESQRRAMIAEVGTQRARIATLESALRDAHPSLTGDELRQLVKAE